MSEEKPVVPASYDPLNTQVGGDHYSKYKIQPVEAMEKLNLDFVRGNILKYLVRYKDKNGVEDLKKAFHYTQILAKKEIDDSLFINDFIEQLDAPKDVTIPIKALLKPASDLCLVQDFIMLLIAEAEGREVELPERTKEKLFK